MRYFKHLLFFFTVFLFSGHTFAQQILQLPIVKSAPNSPSRYFYKADSPLIQYYGRMQKACSGLSRFWAPGFYIKLKFRGNLCKLFINDEVPYGNVHNYVEIVVDDHKLFRIQTASSSDSILIKGLSGGDHTLTICKDTESGNGYLEFAGIECDSLLPLPPKPKLKIEFIGNSITCGYGADTSLMGCHKGQWYDQNNAYMSYGPLTARALHAQWYLTAVSGIGMIHSCCDMKILMPQVFDKVDLKGDSISWDFKQYIPDIVTICLGQNDGIQDSAKFCNAYIEFIKTVRSKYTNAKIILLTSPMAEAALTTVLKKYLTSIETSLHKNGDDNIYKYFFKKRYYKGCDSHPDLMEHQQISAELLHFLNIKILLAHK